MLAVPGRNLFSSRGGRLLGVLPGNLLGRWSGRLPCVFRRILCFNLRGSRLLCMLRRNLFFGNRSDGLHLLPRRLVIAGRREGLSELWVDARKSCDHGQPVLRWANHPGRSLCRWSHIL